LGQLAGLVGGAELFGSFLPGRLGRWLGHLPLVMRIGRRLGWLRF